MTRPTGRTPAVLARAALAALLFSCLAVAACGSGQGSRTTLTVLAEGDVDSLDPGVTNYQFGYMVVGAMQQTLYAYRPGSSEPAPELAAGAPRISRDGKTVSLTIRSGVRFSPPVNREVRAADVRYAIERGFMRSVSNAYVRTYFGSLAGVAEFLSGRRAHIRGIHASGDQLSLKFTKPRGALAARALTLPISAPVPEEYARPLDRTVPSGYGTRPVATGAFMLLAKPHERPYIPGELIRLVRNPNWKKPPRFPAPGVSRIDVREGYAAALAARQILAGDRLVSGDFHVPPEVLARHRGDPRLVVSPLGGVAYVALNTRMRPFANVNVRRAVAAVLDRFSMRESLGGRVAGEIATHFLPPGVSGFTQAGGLRGPGYDFLSHPHGDVGLARSYMRRAGFASGTYSGARVIMVANNDPASRRIAEVTQDGLSRLGIGVKIRAVALDSTSKWCGTVPTDAAICVNAGWLKEFDDPQTMLDAPFSGAAIARTNNPNLSLFDDAAVNKLIARAEPIQDRTKRVDAWAAIDARTSGEVPAIPWLWNNAANLRSSDVDAGINPQTGRWDLASVRLR